MNCDKKGRHEEAVWSKNQDKSKANNATKECCNRVRELTSLLLPKCGGDATEQDLDTTPQGNEGWRMGFSVVLLA